MLPKNSGLQEYKKVLEALPNDKIVVRAEDVPKFVELLTEKGRKAIGLTGEDLYREYQLNNPKNCLRINTKIPWLDSNTKYGRPTLCLMGRTSVKNPVVAVNRKYKLLVRKCVAELDPKEILYFSGATETAAIEGIADMVVDVVYSGKSAEEAGLDVLKRIYSSDVVLLEGRR